MNNRRQCCLGFRTVMKQMGYGFRIRKLGSCTAPLLASIGTLVFLLITFLRDIPYGNPFAVALDGLY